MKEIETKSPRIKWGVLDKEEAEKQGVDVISFDDKNGLLLLNLDKCPKGVTVLGWIDHIVEMGIVFYEANN